MGQKGRGGKIDPKIELLSPIAKELKQAESDVKRKKMEGQSTPGVPIFIPLEPQRMCGKKLSGKRPRNSNNKTLGKIYK